VRKREASKNVEEREPDFSLSKLRRKFLPVHYCIRPSGEMAGASRKMISTGC